MPYSTTCWCLAVVHVFRAAHFANLVYMLVDLEATLYALSFDAVTWDLLQAGSHWAGDSNILETGEDHWLDETPRMTRLIVLSHSLSLCHILVTTFHFGIDRPYVACVATRTTLCSELE